MFRKLLLFMAMVAMLAAPASALDRVQWLYGLNPPSSWLNYQQRDTRFGIGQLIADLVGYGNSASLYSNLSVVPTSGLFVAVQPSAGATSVGSLYQWQNEELTPFGGPGATALPVDAHNIFVQGLLLAATPSIGPLTPPATVGWSQIYGIECQVQTVDQTSQSVNFIAANGAVTPGTAPRDRADTIICQSKAGTAGTSPSAPVIDAGWVGIANVQVAQGQSTIVSGNISPITSALFGGFAMLANTPQLGALNVFTVAQNINVAGSWLTLGQSSQTAYVNSDDFLPVQWSVSGANLSGYLGNNHATVLAGINCTLIAIGYNTSGVKTPTLCGDTLGQWGMASNLTSAANINAKVLMSEANGSTFAQAPPVYTASGAAAGNTEHMDSFTQTITYNGACAGTSTPAIQCSLTGAVITLSGAGAFTSASSYACFADNISGTGGRWYQIVNNSATSAVIESFIAASSNAANGSTDVLHITCEGQ